MSGEETRSTDPRITTILESLTSLRATPGIADTPMIDQIIDQLQRLDTEIASEYALITESQQRFGEFLDVISGMAALDFTKKAWVGEAGTMLDAMAFGINMLSEELAASTVSRAYIDTIFETLVDALIVTDGNGTIQTVNQAAISLFGYPRETLLQQKIGHLFADPQAVAQILNTIAYQRGDHTMELICRTADGHSIPVALSASAMNDANSGMQGIVCTIRDISEHKRAEEALRHSIGQEETIKAQAVVLAELSTPLIPISDHVVVMPLIGSVDSRRAQQVLATLLEGIATTKAEVAILDITGVPVVDTQVANALIHAAQAVNLLGAQVMLTGIRPEVAQTLVGLGVNLRGILTHGTLQSGIAAVLQASRTRDQNVR